MESLRLSARLLAATLLLMAGALRLSAQSWQRLGPEGGMVLSLGVSSAGTVYLGTSDGHIFASEDRGAHWELRGRAGTRTDAIVAEIAPDPREPRRVFAAVWFREAGAGGGVFRSDDGGTSWRPSGLQGEAVRALEFAPSQPETLVAGTRSGVFRSTDAGQTWERISPVNDPELRNVDSIAMDPGAPAVIYAGTYHLPWKTTDGGKTWRPVAAGLIDDSDIMSMRVDATNPARLYLSACSGIYRSDNRGAAWTKLQGIPYAARRTQAIVQDPQNPQTLYAATTEGLWVTRDAGESWERTTPMEWVVNAVVVLRAQGGAAARVLIGTEAQGVLASEDSGRTFASANHGFTHQVAKQLAGDARDPAHLLLLVEGNSVDLMESRDAGKSWSALPATAAADAKAAGWSADRIERVYGSPWGWLAKSYDGSLWVYSEESRIWRRWSVSYSAATKPEKASATGAKSVRHAAVPSGGALGFSREAAYFASPEGVLRCGRAGNCSLLPAFFQASKVSAIWVSPDGQALAAASEGKLGISRDAGQSAVWRDLPDGLRDANWVLWDATRDSGLFLGTARGLYVSHDAAGHWLLAKEGLPGAFLEHGFRSGNVFLVTLEQGGVFASQDGLEKWKRADQDAERSRISGIVETQPGQFLFGSQSEGVLLWNSGRER